jgi:dihydropyrimidinase
MAFGLFPQKGIIAVGSDADIVVIDPEKRVRLSSSALHMNSDCLPYEGLEVQGWPETVVLRGQVLAHEGQLQAAKPSGSLVPRRTAKANPARRQD